MNDADQQLAAIQRKATLCITVDLLILMHTHIQTENRQAPVSQRRKLKMESTKWKRNEITDETDEEAVIQSRGYEKGKTCEMILIKSQMTK